MMVSILMIETMTMVIMKEVIIMMKTRKIKMMTKMTTCDNHSKSIAFSLLSNCDDDRDDDKER